MEEQKNLSNININYIVLCTTDDMEPHFNENIPETSLTTSNIFNWQLHTLNSNIVFGNSYIDVHKNGLEVYLSRQKSHPKCFKI